MPFSDDFKNQWDLAFVPAIQDAGLTPYRGDEKSLGTNMIMRDVTKFIYDAIIIIADISGKNPNVMYELGLAHAAKKNVIILAQKNEDIPFDLNHIRYLEYSPKNLLQLRNDLKYLIQHSLNQSSHKRFDFFPQVKLLTNEIQNELEYLRNHIIELKVSITPPTADIFFNNKFKGTGSVTLQVNKYSEHNTISIAALEHYEHHQEITKTDLDKGTISIQLDNRNDTKKSFETRVSRWLRARKKDPDNPVLMRAIIQYLIEVKAFDEAEEEALELLEIAPTWYMAHNVAASVYFDQKKFDKAIKEYEFAITFRPDHAVGYIGLACAYSLMKQFEKAINYLKKICDNEKLLNSYSYFGNYRIEEDHDFDPLKKSKYKDKFWEIIDCIKNHLKKKELS